MGEIGQEVVDPRQPDLTHRVSRRKDGAKGEGLGSGGTDNLTAGHVTGFKTGFK